MESSPSEPPVGGIDDANCNTVEPKVGLNEQIGRIHGVIGSDKVHFISCNDWRSMHHLRGEIPRFARMGNVPTYVRHLNRHTGSLYAVQDRVKAGLPQA